MLPNLSKLKSNVELLLESSSSPNKIATILKKDIKVIYNIINRIKKKKAIKVEDIKRYKGRPTRVSKREKRVILRDIIRSPKKINKRLL